MIPYTTVGSNTSVAPSPTGGMTGQENFLTSFSSFMYGSDPDGKILLDGGKPVWESKSGLLWIESAVAYNSNRPAGYWMVNTGNPTRDAIATIAMNELGFDNFKRVVEYRQDGRYIAMAREAAFGTLELALGITGLGKLGQAAIRTPKAFKAARAVAGQSRGAAGTPTGRFGPGGGRFGANQPGGFLDRSRTALFGGQYVDPNVLNKAGNPTLRTRPNAFKAVAQRYRDHGLGIRGSEGLVRGTVRSTAKAIKSGLRAAFPKGKVGGRLGALAIPAAIAGIGTARMNRGNQSVAGEEGGGFDGDDIFDGINMQLAEATAGAQRDSNAIQQQYNAIFRELQGMYNLSETEQEKERLRFILADIEAQRDAGLRAIASGYAETAGKIRERAVLSQQETKDRSDRYSNELSQYARQTEQRLIDQQAAQVAGNRGLGIGSGVNPMNEFVGLMNMMPAVQQQYTQRMGDINSEAIQFLADTVSGQGLAQQADLQRLAAATRSGSIASHQGAVNDRIAREQAEMRDALMRLSMAGLSAAQSQQQQQPKGIDGVALREYLASLGNAGYSDKAVSNYLSPIIGRPLTPDEMAVAQYERSRIPMTAVPGAATNPLGP
jgi:hypothetical protein